jgi:hypothetical protein
MPIDVTVIIDLSTVAQEHKRVDDFLRHVERLKAVLEPSDRLRLLLDGSYVTEIDAGWHTARSGTPGLGPLVRAGSSTADAIGLALMRRAEVGRRSLIVAFTQAIDYFSVIEFDALPAIAARADALLHVVLSKVYPGGFGRGRPEHPPTAGALVKAAILTGGGAHDVSRGLPRTFSTIVEEFRTSYVLAYSPRGVEGPGWHDISVTLVNRSDKEHTVRARTGYFVDEPSRR